MYTFNSHLFTAIPKLLGHTRNSISIQLGYSKDTMRRFEEPEDCRVKFLVDLCNAFRLDIRKFFLDGDEVPEYTIQPIDEKIWNPVVMNDTDMSRYMPRKGVFACSHLIYAMNCGKVKFEDVITHELKPGVVNEVNCSSGSKEEGGYWFNIDLFRVLPEKIGVGVCALGKEAGRSAHFYYNVMKNRDVRLSSLVQICNKYRVPIMLFFRKPGDVIPDNIIDDKMDDVGFYPFRLSEFYGKGKRYTYNQVKDILGYTNPRMIRVMSDDSPLTANELIAVCEKLNVSPRFFFIDAISMMNEEDANAVRNTIEKLKSETEQKDIENRMLKSRIRHLEAMMNMKGNG